MVAFGGVCDYYQIEQVPLEDGLLGRSVVVGGGGGAGVWHGRFHCTFVFRVQSAVG